MIGDAYFWLAVIGCGFVTWPPRVLPFMLVKKLTFSPKLLQFLSFVPLTILTALLFQSILVPQEHGFPHLDALKSLALVPTLIVGFRTRDLMKTVLCGILMMALLRLIT